VANVLPATNQDQTRDRSYEYARQRRRRAPHLRSGACFWCGQPFTSWNPRTRWCGDRCRAAAHRGPKVWALVTWSKKNHIDAQFAYFASRQAALAAAPAGEPFTVVDISIPVVPLPTIFEAIREGRRPVLNIPYPSKNRRQRLWE
jgi:hypothetical protein